MTPAEKRIKELIDRWLTSLDLHLQYVDLNDSAYNKVQPWPVHDRPTRWVLELARQKVLELQAANESRLAMGDAKFADALELMMFLANLVGIQHVQRFIPTANPDHHGRGTLTELDGLKPVVPPTKTANAPASPAPPARPNAPPPAPATSAVKSAVNNDSTVAMPRPAPATPVKPLPPPEPVASQATVQMPRPAIKAAPIADDSTREMPRPARLLAPELTESVPVKPASKGAPAKKPTAAPSPSKAGPVTEMHRLMIEDAVRLLKWGRPWHELAEAIARIADRPKVNEVRRILRVHRATIETRAADTETDGDKK
jgi:hypothetical protein